MHVTSSFRFFGSGLQTRQVIIVRLNSFCDFAVHGYRNNCGLLWRWWHTSGLGFIRPFNQGEYNKVHRLLTPLTFSCQRWFGEIIMGKKTAGGFYAVARGRTVGIYLTWDDCKAQVDGFPNARYKKFSTSVEACSFIQENKSSASSVPLPVSGNSKPTFTLPASSRTGRVFSSVKLTEAKPLTVPKASSSGPPKRDLSTLKVTEDRVVNKRRKLDGEIPNSCANLKGFTIDEDGYVVVYTDGACTKNGRAAAKAGVGVWFGNNHPLNISEPVKGRQTNNTAEIQAAERAIKQAKQNGIDKLKVKTDSQFTINCVTKWLHNWKRNNWRLSSGGDVKNKEDLIKLDEAMQNMEIKWSYVAGHAGIEGNEAADRLAVEGAVRSY